MKWYCWLLAGLLQFITMIAELILLICCISVIFLSGGDVFLVAMGVCAAILFYDKGECMVSWRSKNIKKFFHNFKENYGNS
jgi:hypothetical protein